MNFDDAMAAHVIWKIRLARLIENAGGEDFDSIAAGDAGLCAFGKWIRGEGAQYRTTPAYEDVVRKHAHFHACAAEVVRKVEQGDRAAAMKALNGAFEAASRQLVNAVVELKTEARQVSLP
ncbi:CZB domain-containing protein [Sulfuritalea sp.]|uniref:CZB domain-containing protein n=1 Tax=Sulfuritalea sp. TaxID=2480090 RepID=UPI00286DB39A|nr:CZB domain-containing protein [Sulfuritalea sp.]